MNVYVVQHVHHFDDDEDIKFIGVYSSEDRARAAIERLSRKPGFCIATDGFCVDEYQLDEDHWVDGYVSGEPGSTLDT